jgi:nicotinate-nucleotide--dimethylbenzimidazole phosphoribosyltransferase
MEEKIKQLIAGIKPLDRQAMEAAADRQNQLTKPTGALGILEALSIQIAGIQGRSKPSLEHKIIFTLAGDHGVAADGVSAYPPEVTAQMVLNILAGGAGINVLARQVGATVVVADLGVNYDFTGDHVPLDCKIRKGTSSLLHGPAMTRAEAIQGILAGAELVDRQDKIDILGTGEMGIGNTTPSSAIAAVLTGCPVREVTGRGTGVTDQAWEAKVKIIEKALAVNQPDPADGLDVLAKVGGFEIAGLVGVILAGAKLGVPVVIDGFISGAAALVAHALAPLSAEYMIASHQSVEIGHQRINEKIGLRPLLNLDLRLGEGTGAAMGMFLAQCAVAILNEMATFGEAGVADK